MIHVDSEIGRLRRVLVHEPGLEVDTMVPATMEPLLFDDILFGQSVREEHRRFCKVMQYLGIEVVEALDLLAESLGQPGAGAWIASRLQVGHPQWLPKAGDTLAATLVHGARREGKYGVGTLEELFDLPPVANWCFQRDPQVVLGDAVVFGHMSTFARRREALLAQTMFRFHPDFKDTPVLMDAAALPGAPPVNLEGGDVSVLSPDVVAVGISERTDRGAVLALGRALAARGRGPRRLLAVALPHRRAYMHLDTVFTQIDHDACLAFPPVLLDDGPEAARVFEMDLEANTLEFKSAPPFLEALKKRGLELQPIPCGGQDLINQQREQWTDGSNALAVAPGVVFLYKRNRNTADTLAQEGFRILTAEDILMGRESAEPDRGQRVCILLTCHEISRARGGPHCLTHPLNRDSL